MSVSHVASGNGPVKAVEALLLRLEQERLLKPIKKICADGNIRLEDAFGESRHKRIVRVRHLIWWWLRDEKKLSYPDIADLFGYDHTAVQYGVRVAGRALGLVEYADRRQRRVA